MSVEQSTVAGRVVRLELQDTTVAVRRWGSDNGRPLFFWHALGAVTSGAG